MTRTCPKCGNTDVHILFKSTTSRTTKQLGKIIKHVERYNLIGDYYMPKEDFLLCNCRTCQYGWSEDTLDKEVKDDN